MKRLKRIICLLIVTSFLLTFCSLHIIAENDIITNSACAKKYSAIESYIDELDDDKFITAGIW